MAARLAHQPVARSEARRHASLRVRDGSRSRHRGDRGSRCSVGRLPRARARRLRHDERPRLAALGLQAHGPSPAAIRGVTRGSARINGMPDDTAQRSWHFKRLRWSLQSLAEAGSGQPALFPEHMMNAGDLALDFDHWSSFVRGSYEKELSAAEIDALTAIDRKLSTMSRDGAEFDLDLWTD